MEQTVDNTKKYLLYFGVAALIVIGIVVLFGRMEFHNELEREQLPDTFIGYLNEETYYDMVHITEGDWPEWLHNFQYPSESVLQFDETLGGRIGIYANLIYYENRYENRTWFSGRLIERESEYYYKPEGMLYVKAVYELNKTSEIAVEHLVPQGYNYVMFNGQKE